ncbi:hypothetical protein AAY473_023464 [Plecturocebus cupreus]
MYKVPEVPEDQIVSASSSVEGTIAVMLEPSQQENRKTELLLRFPGWHAVVQTQLTAALISQAPAILPAQSPE